MAKRFIDTNLFKSGRLKRLPGPLKLFYLYLLCEADHTGIWRVELDVAELRIGMKLPTESEILHELAGFAIPFDAGAKWYLPDFVAFQYGELNPANRVHKSILDALDRYGLTELQASPAEALPKPLPSPYQAPTEPLPSPAQGLKDKDKEMDKEMDKDKGHTKKKSPPDPDFIKTYTDFLATKSIPARINGADAVALKEIQAFMTKHETVQTGQKTALELWQTFLENWHHLTAWQQSQIQPRQINSQLPNMIETMKQAYNGKKQNPAGGTGSAAGLARAIREGLDKLG